MNKLLLMLSLTTTMGVFGMENLENTKITLSSAEVLNQRLDNHPFFKNFNAQTNIGNKLGGQEMRPLTVLMHIDTALADFQKIAKLSALNKALKPTLIQKLLEEHPEAIQYLIQKK